MLSITGKRANGFIEASGERTRCERTHTHIHSKYRLRKIGRLPGISLRDPDKACEIATAYKLPNSGRTRIRATANMVRKLENKLPLFNEVSHVSGPMCSGRIGFSSRHICMLEYNEGSHKNFMLSNYVDRKRFSSHLSELSAYFGSARMEDTSEMRRWQTIAMAIWWALHWMGSANSVGPTTDTNTHTHMGQYSSPQSCGTFCIQYLRFRSCAVVWHKIAWIILFAIPDIRRIPFWSIHNEFKWGEGRQPRTKAAIELWFVSEFSVDSIECRRTWAWVCGLFPHSFIIDIRVELVPCSMHAISSSFEMPM